MTPTIDALSRASRDLFNVKVLWIVIWPMLVSILLWVIIGVTIWDTIEKWLLIGLTGLGMQNFLEGVEPHWIAKGIQSMAHILLFVPLVFITTLVITAVFAMPVLIDTVAGRDYPELERNRGGSISGNLINAMVAICIFLGIWLLSLPLWLIGVGVLVPFIAATYLNQRLFRYDALAEHADGVEMRAVFNQYQTSWWGLGLLTSLLQFVPIVNLFAPVLTGLAFVHFGLARLAELRQPLLSTRVSAEK